MLLSIAICRIRSVPYLVRGDSHPQSKSAGIRRAVRHIVAWAAVAGSAGGLSAGKLNDDFYRKYRAKRIFSAPYSVDDERFSSPPDMSRTVLLSTLGLRNDKPVIMFCGKLYPGKRPLDILGAAELLPYDVVTIFVGEGVLADDIRRALGPGMGAVTGFVNQSELPNYYHAADVFVLPSESEKWGLVVNEAMAAGTLPVVSDRVGAAEDLVRGIGEVYECGNVEGLAEALGRALVRAKDATTCSAVKARAAGYSLDRTAVGFEDAVLAIRKGD